MEFSEEEANRLVESFKALGVKPKSDSPEDLRQWMLQFSVTQETKETKAADQAGNTENMKMQYTQFPRLANFSGETGKNDVRFDLWKYDVQCLREERIHTPDSIRQAIRNSLRGEAGRIVMRLGPKASVAEIMEKLECVYGTVEMGENLMSEFYAAQQKMGEDVTSWSCRLEDLMAKAQEKNSLSPETVNEMLRSRFWTGLNQKLKDSSRHKYDTIKDFDRLRVAIRAIEHEHGVIKPTTQVNMVQESKLEKTLVTLAEQMKTMQQDMAALKKEMSAVKEQNLAVGEASRNTKWADSERTRRRPMECSHCHRRGHVAADCYSRYDIQGHYLNE